MSNLLFIAPERLEDAVLSTGALAQAQAMAPDGETVIICTPEAAPLFRAAPGFKTVRPRLFGGGLLAGLKLRRAAGADLYDLAVDLSGRSSLFGLPARRRLMRRKAPVLRHRVEDFAAALGAPAAPPRLFLDEQARADAAAALPLGAEPVLALGPGAAQALARWPAERFAAAARRLASAGPLQGARVVLLGGADSAEICADIARSLDSDGVAALDLSGRLDLPACGALLERATLFIGAAAPLMHLAAAAGAPTLGLFGPTDERVYAPYGPRARALRGRPFEQIMARGGPMAGLAGGASLLEDISVDAAEVAALDLLRAGGL
jgi:ADP-heptose:LPS heptosyltransferase